MASHGTTYFTRDEKGMFASQRVPSASAPNRRIYPLVDHLGSTRTLTDENGTVVRRYDYEPYGKDKTVPGTWTASTPLRFAGGELDPSGLYHFGQRYYDPTSLRWTQQDPLNQAADLAQVNRYAYVGGDPLNRVDPSGLFRCQIEGCPDIVLKPLQDTVDRWKGNVSDAAQKCILGGTAGEILATGVENGLRKQAGKAFVRYTGYGAVGSCVSSVAFG